LKKWRSENGTGCRPPLRGGKFAACLSLNTIHNLMQKVLGEFGEFKVDCAIFSSLFHSLDLLVLLHQGKRTYKQLKNARLKNEGSSY